MPKIKRSRPRGLDLRSNDINRDPRYASEIENLEPNSAGDWEKRFGTLEKIIAAFNVLDAKQYKKGGTLVLLSPTGLKLYNGTSTPIDINLGGSAPASNWSERASWGEYSGVLYFTDPAGEIDLYKYDGYMAYRAGMRKPAISTAAAAGIYYYRVALYFIDMQGNIVWGDYAQLETQHVDDAAITYDHTSGTEFYHKYGRSGAVQTVDSGNLTLTVDGAFGHNYVKDDWMRVKVSGEDRFKPLQVDSVTAGTITYTSASVGSDTFDFNDSINSSPGDPYYLEQRVHAALFMSLNENFGYKLVDTNAVNINTATLTINNLFANASSDMEDVYDTTKLKGLPPRFKYIEFYGNVMVGFNQSVTKNLTDPPSSFPEEAIDPTQINESTLYWSDLGVGSSVETFSPSDQEVIGRTDEGAGMGLFSSNDSLVVLKERQIYFINGILTGRLFRLRSALTNGIGCIAHRSIREYRGGCLFMSFRGIYFTGNGNLPIELSDLIEPLFTQDTTGLDLTKTVTELMEMDEKIYFAIPSSNSSNNDIVVGYDYRWDDWFLHKGIKTSSAFTRFGDNLFFINENNKISTNQDAKADDGVAIAAKYSTAWFNQGEPSLKKKFTNFVLWAVGAINWTATMTAQRDWDTNKEDSMKDIEITNTVKINDSRPPSEKAKSIRYIIENSTLNENMLISGYDHSYEWDQMATKGEE